jgi:hypothetical protein
VLKCASRSSPGAALRPACNASAAILRKVFDLLAGTVRLFSDCVILFEDRRLFFGVLLIGKLDGDFVGPCTTAACRSSVATQPRGIDVDADHAA